MDRGRRDEGRDELIVMSTGDSAARSAMTGCAQVIATGAVGDGGDHASFNSGAVRGSRAARRVHKLERARWGSDRHAHVDEHAGHLDKR